MALSLPQNPALEAGYNLVVCILASGSKGNAIYVSDSRTSILVDAGLSGVAIERRFRQRGLRPENLDAIIVSHEHADHIQGVGVLSRRYNLPVYMNPKTTCAAESGLGDIKELVNFECGATFHINTLSIHPFSISHDATDPAGFTISQNGSKMAIATDLGIVTSMVKSHLKECHLLIVEANHDPQMLFDGPYPWPTKQRISSRVGHLSNEDSCHLLREVQHDKLQHVVLAHLSETNNTPQKAFAQACKAINVNHVQLHVARQNECGDLIYVR
ncbi:MAG: MBL fold metallo-hydrolase [Desulfobacterales bacterium]|nr:MBL fold metallo-hydrolase [Desulfobacterales bacterium]